MPRERRAIGTYDTTPWTNNTIPYVVDNSFSELDKVKLQNVMNTFESETCLKFVKYRREIHPNWLKIENGERCFSQIGMQNTGEQALVLAKVCREYGLIAHELAHTIGLIHEMSRPDRNQHIQLFEKNIQDQAKAGFEIEHNHYKLFNTIFDFQSILMYSPYEFSKNGLPVWLKMNASDKTPIFDIREKDISFWDVKAINEMYQCAKNCLKSSCPPNSFKNSQCVCQTIEEFAQRRCIDNPSNATICRNASESNYCFEKPAESSALCRKTCGRCFRYGEYGNTQAPSYKCVDQDSVQCQRNKNDGYCYFDTWTKVFCKKSCNTCSNHSDPSIIEFICKDRHNTDLCKEWAKNGQCDYNPGFMKAQCAMSCGSCSSNDTIDKAKAPCRNYSPDSYCDAIAKENKCDGTTLKICLGSCGQCGTDYERNQANLTETEIAKKHENLTKTDCKDLLDNCEYFADDGHCQKQKESMKFHCAKTCNFCKDNLCQNDDNDAVCDDVKQRGLCSSHAGFANRCQRTCEICKGDAVIKDIKCKDHDNSYVCAEVVRRNQCNTERGQQCRLTCSLCNNTSSFNLPIEDVNSTFISTTTVPCVNEDNEESCEHLRERGLCQSYLNRAVLCRKSCSLCVVNQVMSTTQGPCTNVVDDENCNAWASTGYCNENVDYMKENCAKACNHCKSNEVTEENNSPCVSHDKSDQCFQWIERGYCQDYPDYMKANCPKRCEECIGNRLSTVGPMAKVTELCTNTESDESCESWKENYCSYSHIADMCKKSCGLCQ